MKKTLHYQSAIIAILLSTGSTNLFSQCVFNANAVATPLVLQCSGGQNNRSGLAFNPVMNLYYSVDAGSSGYPIETYDLSGTQTGTIAQGNDYRGLWWNDSLQTLEGNSFNGGGIVSQNLDASGIPLGTVTTIFPTNTQPDVQSCGTLNFDDNEIIYITLTGNVDRYDRYTGAFISTNAITGLPVPFTSINFTSIIYTGCPGKEIGVYDFINSRIYLVDKSTYAYTMSVQLPPTSITNDRFRFAWANNLIWIFEPVLMQWQSFDPLSTNGISEVTGDDMIVYPNPCKGKLSIRFPQCENGCTLAIDDVTGKTILVKSNIKEKNIVLDISSQTKGIYFLKISKDGYVYTKKIVLM